MCDCSSIRLQKIFFLRSIAGRCEGHLWGIRLILDTQRLLKGTAIIGERLNRPTIVIPTDDVGAIFRAEQATTLHRLHCLTRKRQGLPPSLQRITSWSGVQEAILPRLGLGTHLYRQLAMPNMGS